MNGVERLREYAESVRLGGECRILHAHHGDFARECSERECDDCRAAYLQAIADEIERDRADSPKVLDADGEPLEVGQTVREVDGTGHPFKVVSIRTSAGRAMEPTVVTCDVGDGTSEHFLPSQLTHQRPVLDADGAPIKVGDEVWNLNGGGPYTVMDLDPEHMHASVTCNTHDGRLDWGFEAAYLTHAKPEPPDTWERIEEDARGLDSGVDRELFTHTHEDIVRRCRALAERGGR